MVNLLGVDDTNDFLPHYAKAQAAHPEVKIHTYGKGARRGRKMGHVTVVSGNAEWALEEARLAAQVLTGQA
jgi:5-(carboxyamino)imidazole ribonucleotide synthase